MKVIFFGTPVFAANVLEYLLQNQINVVAVVSKPDRPKGRSGAPVETPVKFAAKSFSTSLPVYQPEIVSAADFAPTLEAFNADLFVVVAYGEIIKQHLLDMPKLGCINLHTSLLPKYRGAAPIQRAILNGELETGVTIMHMAKKMDAGEIIKQTALPINKEMTFGALEEALCGVGKEMLLEVLTHFDLVNKSKYSQNELLVTFAPKIELEDCEIDWSWPAQKIHNLVRGVNPYPGAWCWIMVRNEKKRLKINQTKIHLFNSLDQPRPGTITNLNCSKSNLFIATCDGVLELCDVQLEGKKRMSSEELTRGIPRTCLSFNI